MGKAIQDKEISVSEAQVWEGLDALEVFVILFCFWNEKLVINEAKSNILGCSGFI